MISYLELLLVFIIIIILVIVNVLTAISSQRITTLTDYKSNSDLVIAHSRLTVASITGWIGLIILVIIFISYIGKTTEKKDKKTSGGIILFLFIALVLIFIVGVLCSIASVDMDKAAKSTNIKETGARSLSNTAAVLSIISGIVGIVALIYAFVRKPSKKSKTKTNKDETKDE